MIEGPASSSSRRDPVSFRTCTASGSSRRELVGKCFRKTVMQSTCRKNGTYTVPFLPQGPYRMTAL
ncbi:MAG: hypothetical protein DWQ39_09995 [Bacteroidetes bacterium]|nr:MAG: hypothetical protein DWQ33_01305 [Bacteroidota bacterium]REK03520.1 MAG: hypothetical protein DWQ39_09995 [Bacteroidota bacterium]